MFLEITLLHSNFGSLGEFPSKRGQKDTPEYEDVGAQGPQGAFYVVVTLMLPTSAHCHTQQCLFCASAPRK